MGTTVARLARSGLARSGLIQTGRKRNHGSSKGNSTSKGPGQKLVSWKIREEAYVAGGERVKGRKGGGEGREGTGSDSLGGR